MMSSFDEMVVPQRTESKPWWQSKGVIGGLIAAIAPVVGWSVAQTADFTDVILQVVSAAGGLFAIYGRVVAKRVIDSPMAKLPLPRMTNTPPR